MRSKNLISFILAFLFLAACGGETSLPEPPQPVIVSPSPQPDPTPQPDPQPAPAPQPAPCMEVACEELNNAVVLQIYDDIFNAGQSGLVSTLFAEDFVQNDASISPGIEGQQAYYDNLLTTNPDHRASVKRTVADGDYVAVHWHYSATPDDEFSGSARVDLYKLADQLIIEVRSYAMAVGATTASGNSVFSDLYEYTSGQPNNNTDLEEQNKQLVADFYVQAFNENDVQLIDELVDADYIQHNPFVPNGRQGLRDFVANSPAANISLFLSLAQNDLIWTFRADARVVDIWRYDNNINKIVEHWDVF